MTGSAQHLHYVCVFRIIACIVFYYVWPMGDEFGIEDLLWTEPDCWLGVIEGSCVDEEHLVIAQGLLELTYAVCDEEDFRVYDGYDITAGLPYRPVMDDTRVLPVGFVMVFIYPIDMGILLAIVVDYLLREIGRAIVDNNDLFRLSVAEPRRNVLF